MRNPGVLFVFIFISACSLIPAPPAVPSMELRPIPSPTLTAIPSLTPTPATPTVAATSTPDPQYFREDFDEVLDTEWTWVREDPQNWSLVTLPGSLQINVASGYVAAHNNSNLLLRPAPMRNFQIETQITFRPTINFQFAGLIIYENDSNFIQAGRAYCSSVGCVGAGLYMDHYQRGVIIKPDFGQQFGDLDPLLLRLSRREDTYTFEASTDGKVWFIIGNHVSDMQPLQVGLVTGQRLRGQDLPATFEYFEARSLP